MFLRSSIRKIINSKRNQNSDEQNNIHNCSDWHLSYKFVYITNSNENWPFIFHTPLVLCESFIPNLFSDIFFFLLKNYTICDSMQYALYFVWFKYRFSFTHINIYNTYIYLYTDYSCIRIVKCELKFGAYQLKWNRSFQWETPEFDSNFTILMQDSRFSYGIFLCVLCINMAIWKIIRSRISDR